MALQGTPGFVGVIMFLIVFGVMIIVPLTTTGTHNNVNHTGTPPPGNELAVPLGASLLGIDDLYTQRICNSSSVLPGRATNERLLSNQVFVQSASVPDPRNLNALTWSFGQFIDHDTILSVEDAGLVGDSIEMVPNTGTFLDVERVQRRYNEPLNSISAHIDGGTIYGDYKDPSKLAQLRQSIGGVLQCKLREGPGRTPYLKDGHFFCGDERCSENMMLTSIHALFLREHNWRCDQLPRDWTEEQRMWKARALTVATIQHIAYSEWLPTLYGSQSSMLNTVPHKGTYTRISTEFGTAAYRFGHSMIAETLGELVLRDLFFNPNLTISIGVDGILSRGIQQHAERVDNKVVESLRNFLFTTDHFTVSEDLVTRNLYRAREVGMASYEQLCTCFGTPPTGTLNPGTPTDPLLGLLSEPLMSGSSLPRTLALIIAEQFSRLRDNDENFYLHPYTSPLSRAERYAITKTNMRTIILRNTDLAPGDVPHNAFKLY